MIFEEDFLPSECNQDGATVVEFAFAFSLLMFLLSTMTYIGIVLYGYVRLKYVLYEATTRAVAHYGGSSNLGAEVENAIILTGSNFGIHLVPGDIDVCRVNNPACETVESPEFEELFLVSVEFEIAVPLLHLPLWPLKVSALAANSVAPPSR